MSRANSAPRRIGIIGGSGLYQLEGLTKQKWDWLVVGMLFVNALTGFGQDQAFTNTSPGWQAVFSQIARDWPKVPQMSTTELARQLALPEKSRPVLIDVRSPAEFAVSHLSGAINAESAAEISALVKMIPPKRPVILYCSVGLRSSQAAGKLLAAGRTIVFNLKGSIFQWANEGRTVVRNGQAVTEVHPYNEHWGRLLDPSHHPKSPP